MAIQASKLMRHQAADGSGHQQQIILRTPAELEPGELEQVRERIRRAALSGNTLGADLAAQAAALTALHEVLNPMASDMIGATMGMMREPGKQMAEIAAAAAAQPFGAMDVARAALAVSSDLHLARGALVDLALVGNALSNRQPTRSALDDLSMALNALGNGGFSLGALDDTDRAIGRLHEQRAPAVVQRLPEPPAERVQVVHLEDEVLLAELDRRLRAGVFSPKTARSMERKLQTYTSQGKRGPKEPSMETKIRLVKDFERLRDKKGISQEIYVAHHADKIKRVSVRSLQKYIKDVELWRESHDDTE